jgi:ribosomal protein L35AE/L33A
MIELQLNTISEKELYIFTKPPQVKKTKDSEYFILIIKTIWGRISKTHGNTGAVLARFAHNLPARAIGATLRVMLFPQRD